jgi:hypothetical protein
LINKGLHRIPEKISFWQEKYFEGLDWIRESNPQLFPQGKSRNLWRDKRVASRCGMDEKPC